MKYAVVYWSGTGNTAQMAEAIAEGIRSSGNEVDVLNVSEISPASVDGYDALALGCPSMGAEVLEEVEMEPFIEDSKFEGKRVALFGSYDWGDCQWMRDWEERMENEKQAFVFGEGLTVHLTPGKEEYDQCFKFGLDFTKG